MTTAILSPEPLVRTAWATIRRFHGTPTLAHCPALSLEAGEMGEEVLPCSLDVAFVQHCGYRAYHDRETRRSAWPIPDGFTTHELALFGKANGVLYQEPLAGDIVLLYSKSRKHFIHCGVLLKIGREDVFDRTRYYEIVSAEGNTDHRGFPGRGHTMKMRRTFTPRMGDRFLRWTELGAMAIAEARSAA